MDVNNKIEAFEKIPKIKFFGGGGGGGGVGIGVGLGGVRVNVVEELKFLGKFTKQIWGGVGGGGGGGGGVVGSWGGGGGSGWWGWVRMDVHEELKFL